MKTKKVYELYATDVKSFILSRVKNEAVAKDLLQETFIKIHTRLDSLKDIKKLKPWVLSIARNVTTDHFREAGKTSDIEKEQFAAEDSNKDHTKEDCLQGIIKSLPKKYQDVIILYDIQGLKQSEISDQLGLPLPTVKSQIQRGRKLVAQGFVHCCDFKLNDDGLLVGELQDKGDCKICNEHVKGW